VLTTLFMMIMTMTMMMMMKIPIDVTLVGIVTEVSDEHAWNA